MDSVDKQKNSAISEESEGRSKQKYVSPTVTVFGDVRQITRGNTPGTFDDCESSSEVECGHTSGF